MTTASTAYTERTVTVRDGVRLAVRDRGPIDAEATVVLLHGLCLEQGSWAGQIHAPDPAVGCSYPDHQL